VAEAVETITPAKKGPSIVIQFGALLLMTAAAAGMGWVSGGFLTGGGPASGASGHSAASAHGSSADGHGGSAEGHGSEVVSDTVIPLEAITTNIGAPTDVWVRMEASIVLDAPQGPELPGIIHQDLLAYLRTIKMHQIEGASGYRHLKADLEERASIRSDGHVKSILIKTLLFE
jgi:flagellar protein FliL